MSNLRTTSIFTLLFLTTPVANATNLDKDFQRCASAALSERKQSAAIITIDNGGLKWNELDHDLSGRKLEYRMRLVNKVSGENLGSITCTLSHLGELISSAFDR